LSKSFRTCFKFYCMFYFTCDRPLNPVVPFVAYAVVCHFVAQSIYVSKLVTSCRFFILFALRSTHATLRHSFCPPRSLLSILLASCFVFFSSGDTSPGQLNLLACFSVSIGVGDGGQGGGHTPPPQKKKSGKIFFGQLLCKIRAFSGKNHVKLKWNFVNFRANITKNRVF